MASSSTPSDPVTVDASGSAPAAHVFSLRAAKGSAAAL
jgi:hypothetical protein